METRQGEVSGNREAIVLSGDDVIDLEKGRVIGLWHKTVFADPPCTTPNQFDERLLHESTSPTLLPCGLFEGSTSLGVKNTEQTAGIGKAAKFLTFTGGEGAELVAGSEVINSRVIFHAESELKQVPSKGRCEVLAVTENPLQNCYFAGAGFGSFF